MNKISSPSKIWTIIKHEYITKIKTKGFIIGTLLGPVIMVALIAIPMLVTMLSMNTVARKIAILDKSEKIGYRIVSTDSSKYFQTTMPEKELKAKVLKEELDGYLIIPEDILKIGKVSVYTRGGGGIAFIAKLQEVVSDVVRNERLQNAGVDLKVIDIVEKGVDVQTQKITEKGTEKDYTEAYAIVGYIFGLVIYMLMFIYGSFVMRGVIEEKANRIVEVLASSAKPFEIMMGKVIGIGAVGLTQVLFWAVLSMIILNFGGSIVHQFVKPENIMQQGIMAQPQMNQLPMGFEIPYLSPWLFVGFVFYFLSGYFLFATLFAAVGSAVDQESDAQQLQTPVSVLIVIPILFIGYIITSPEAPLSVILSLFPFFSPMLMMVRISASPVPIWQIALSVFLMIFAFIASIWVAARIYRVGILMYGKKPSFKDIIRWFRLAK